MWFWPRGHVPLDVIAGIPEPTYWGVPASSFAGGCDIKRYFAPQQIVLNLNFCGDWAGYFWKGTCAQKAITCRDYVADNPGDFQEAYWSIYSLRVYTIKGEEEDPERKGSERTAITVPISETAAPTVADVQGSSATVGPIHTESVNATAGEMILSQFHGIVSEFVLSVRNGPDLPW